MSVNTISTDPDLHFRWICQQDGSWTACVGKGSRLKLRVFLNPVSERWHIQVIGMDRGSEPTLFKAKKFAEDAIFEHVKIMAEELGYKLVPQIPK